MAFLGGMGRAALVAVLGTVIGVAIAGFPDRSQGPPVRLSQDPPPDDADTLVTGAPLVGPEQVSAPTTLRPPAQVRVMTVNASNVPGAARRLGIRLQEAGYSAAAPVPDQRRFAQTFVRYRPGFEAEAAALAAMVGVEADVVEPLSTEPSVAVPESVHVTVVVGDDLATPA